ncbi:MAG: hypothetical protein V3V08_24425 [Nannocystaceae bacterium]
MLRTACVDVPDFGIQLLYQRHPDWKKRGYPVAVVTDDRQNGTILMVNDEARKARILPGYRYSQGLALAMNLRAGQVPRVDFRRGVEAVCGWLRKFSPKVEPYIDEPGVFWLDGSGLEKLYKTPSRWARAIRSDLTKRNYEVRVVVGFRRFPSYVVVKALRNDLLILKSPDEEYRSVGDVPLANLALRPKLRDDLSKLGVITVKGFLRLPSAAVAERFGEEASKLWRLASGETWDPLLPDPERPVYEQREILDFPEVNTIRLLFLIKRALSPLLLGLAERGLAVGVLFIDFLLDRHCDRHRLDALRPAEATLDPKVLLRLIHLRLESSPPAAGVIEMTLSVHEVVAPSEQLQLFATKPRRDLRAANEAFARLRAEFGEDSVVRPVLTEGHMPEASFKWEVIDHALMPQPRAVQTRCLVRRVYARPLLLPPQNRQIRDDGWLLRGLDHGPIVRLLGPYIISGGWWRRAIHREYHFAETGKGDLLWVYFDRCRRRWFLHGQVL